MVDINRLGSDIQVAEPDRGRSGIQMRLEIASNVVEPCELKRILFRGDRIALRHVCIDDRNAVDYGLDNSDIFVIGTFMKPMDDTVRLVSR